MNSVAKTIVATVAVVAIGLFAVSVFSEMSAQEIFDKVSRALAFVGLLPLLLIHEKLKEPGWFNSDR